MKALLASLLLVASAALPIVAQTAVRDSLRNVSTKQTLAEGTTITIGFVAEKSGTYLIRAVGPSLAQFGVAAPLGNPAMRLASRGVIVAANDDWGVNATTVTEVTALAGAFPLASNSRDAAVSVLLLPGAYTVEVQASDGPTPAAKSGEVLVEVYQVNP